MCVCVWEGGGGGGGQGITGPAQQCYVYSLKYSAGTIMQPVKLYHIICGI